MHLYKDQFSESYDFPRVSKASKILIIASTARCGSHMLGHALHSTNCFGYPLEYANPANLAEWKKLLGVTNIQRVMSEIQKRRTSTNGVFGIKVHYPHIKNFGGFENLLNIFPNAFFILLSRNDVLRQAVSLSIAKQTGVWISGQEPTSCKPFYDAVHIDKCLRETIANNSSWRYSLAANGCNYIEMNFDQIRLNLHQSIEKIGKFTGVEVGKSALPNEQVTAKQSNEINEKWAKKFISDFEKSRELISAKGLSTVEKTKIILNILFS